MFDRLKQKSAELKENYESYKEEKQEEREAFLEEHADDLPKIFKATSKFNNIQIDEVSDLFRVLNFNYETAPKKKSKLAGATLFFATAGISSVVSAGNAVAGAFHKKGYFRYTDLISYELIMDEDSVSSGGLGRAVVGGALLGGAGAIVGGVTGKKKTKRIVNSMAVKLTVNDVDNPLLIIPLITKKTKTKSKDYKRAETEAHQILATLELITRKAEESLSAEDLNMVKLINDESKSNDYDELVKLKELLDSGIINQEEFDAKKKQILDI